MENKICLKGEHLVKRFGALCAVSDVSLELREHEILALIGPNGAGKSTLLSLLAGLLSADEGSAFIMNTPVHDPTAQVKRHLGFLSGDTLLYDRLTVEETLLYFGKLYGLSGDTLRKRLLQLRSDFQLDSFFGQRCGSLSSGQLQRTNFARALIHDPKVLILDEATNNLDVLSQAFVIETVRRLRDEGRAILFASHQMGEVEALANRIVILAEGKVIESGAMSEFHERAAGRGLSIYLQELLTQHKEMAMRVEQP